MSNVSFSGFWDRLPFAGRLLFTASLALITAGLVMLYTSAREDAAQAVEDLHAQLRSELNILPPSLAELLVIGDFSTLQQTLDHDVRRANVSRIRYRDTSGATLESRDERGASRAPAWFVAWLGLRDLSGEAPTVVGGRNYGILEVTVTAHKEIDRAWARLVQHLSILLLAIVLDFIGIWLVLRTGLKPLRVLDAGSGALGKGDFSVRIPPRGSPELRRSIEAFNQMAASLERLMEEVRIGQASLRESEERFREALEHAPIGMAIVSPQGKFLQANRALCDILGYTQDELRALGLENVTYPEDLDADLAQLRRLESGETQYYEIEKRYVRKDGGVVQAQLTASLLRDADGRPRQIIKQVQDISERKRAEARLREASLYARSLIEASLDPLVTISTEGRITDVNVAFEQATGLPREELVGSLFASYFTDPEQAQDAYRKAFSDGAVKDCPLAIRHLSGSRMDVLYNATVYRNEHGEVQGVLAAARDVSARKRLEDELKVLNRDLNLRVEREVANNREKDHLLIQQSRLAAMGEMVHNIAHQWRQPLNALSIMLSNIEDDFEYDSATAELLQRDVKRARSLLQSMSATIDDFRNFFRPDRDPGDFELGKAVEDALFVIEASLKNNHIEVVKELSAGLRTNGFSNQFAQVVLNILANAKEAIQHRGGGGGLIRVGLASSGAEAVLTVEDDGGGIPEAILPKIFDPYFTTKESGSGIGLYMSKMIVERNFKGKIWATNAGAGARMTITLPLTTEGRTP